MKDAARYLILAGARMPTLDNPDIDTLIVKDDKIAAIGAWQDMKSSLPRRALLRDLAGATLLPGFTDGHVHVAATGFLETAIDCVHVRNLSELFRSVEIAAQGREPGELILGLRLATDELEEERDPTVAELMAAAPHHPVYIRHLTGHSSLANPLALELLDFPVSQPGVCLDEDGAPSGRLIAQATQLATQRMYARYAQQIGYQAAFRATAERAAEAGCTTVHALDDLEAVRALMDIKDDLPVRVIPYAQTFDVEAVRRLGLPRLGGCHGCALDGDFDMHTAALLEPYVGSLDHCGVLYHDDHALEVFVASAHREGLQLAFHAVGDLAVEQALRAFEHAQAVHPRGDARHRIEHAQLMTEAQIKRAKAAGVVVSVQPSFNYVWPHQTYPQYIGKRSSRIDPLASLRRAGIPLVGGSDSTVTPLQPLLGVHSAVNHSRSEERLSVAEAIDIFTRQAAYSTFDEGRRGSLETGMDADLVVVDEDPFDIDPAELESVSVLMTVTRGQVVFEDYS
ncbi:MAG: amidohydrolase [Deinococcota bacterium]|nr:amidohydrolase [Deinococcota bacterium]